MNFYKYSATGNDFIVIDNRKEVVDATDIPLFARICERRTNIGADGVLLLENSEKYDFRMKYINADGNEVDMCGNGARTIASFATFLQIPKDCSTTTFETNNGIYKADFLRGDLVKISMNELYDIDKINTSDLSSKYAITRAGYMNTGVPHLILELDERFSDDLVSVGRELRNDIRFIGGVNVNFLSKVSENELKVVTYERGVEDLTLACGTGATAAAIFYSKYHNVFGDIKVQMPGGELIISVDEQYKDIYLCGKVEKIFEGKFSI